MYLLKYRWADGAIVSSWTGNADEVLLPNIVADDQDYGYLLLTETTFTPRELYERCYVVEGMLAEKTVLTIAATPLTFDADGVEECLITVEPFVPCTLLVKGEAAVLTTEDPLLVLTTTTPGPILVALAAQVTHWAAPVLVEAV